MEKRLVLAVLLMVAVMVLSNLLFPPLPMPEGELPPDTTTVLPAPEAEVAEEDVGAVTPPGQPTPGEEGVPGALPGEAAPAQATPGEPPAEAVALEPPPPVDTVLVRTPLHELRFETRGAALIGAGLLDYLSFAEPAENGQRVELVREGDRLLGFRVAVGGDTLDLRGAAFEASRLELALTAESGADSLSFRHAVPGTPLALVLTYRFRPGSYRFEVSGRLEGLGERGYTLLTSLGRGLRTNEADQGEDTRQMAWAVLDREGDVATGRLEGVDPDELRVVENGPFRWAASKSKYFLAAYITESPNPGFGGLIVRGNAAERSADLELALPVPADAPAFGFGAYLGPQDFGRLKAAGEGLQNVNPFGWRWLQPVIRPLAGLIIAILVWMRDAFQLAYGWVLILFGVGTRLLLFPLYQKSMRAQMSQMQVQPLIRQLQEKYKDEPQKMQREMMRLYKEHNINPLAGCLPMLLPFPILITLFFVFQNTIEFRGVPFLWLPDLSLKDPLYIVPLFMGGSMLLLNWIGQRGMESNAQMKMISYAMPVVFTFLFANFASGLNLYYATSNIASLPQQIYLSRERRKARAAGPTVAEDADGRDDGRGEGRKGSPAGAAGKRREAKAAGGRSPRAAKKKASKPHQKRQRRRP